MKQIFRHFLFIALLLFVAQGVMGQATVPHKVKKKETLYGITRDYGISLQQLVEANPEMASPDYKLKKGDIIRIPVVASNGPTSSPTAGRAISLGVMLPLHDFNGDGRRMVEYYRGVLMACDSMKREGISVDVHAWNLPDDGNVNNVLQDPVAARCDIIIGPLYSKYMDAMSDFVAKHGIMLVVPFSINAPQLYNNPHIFQVYQSVSSLNESTARRCTAWFKDYHPVIIDCQDVSTTKAEFTSQLRRQLDADGMTYNVTSLQTADDAFSRAFADNKPNLVVLNTASSKHLLAVFAKLKNLAAARPNVEISIFGYTDWMMYVEHQKVNFHRFNVYIPAPYYTNLDMPAVKRFEKKYKAAFQQDMQQYMPRFGMTGFDHAVFFLRGLSKYGKTFDGAAGRFGYPPVQTPLKFERIGSGGYQNRAFMFIHYKPDGDIETINY